MIISDRFTLAQCVSEWVNISHLFIGTQNHQSRICVRSNEWCKMERENKCASKYVWTHRRTAEQQKSLFAMWMFHEQSFRLANCFYCFLFLYLINVQLIISQHSSTPEKKLTSIWIEWGTKEKHLLGEEYFHFIWIKTKTLRNWKAIEIHIRTKTTKSQECRKK